MDYQLIGVVIWMKVETEKSYIYNMYLGKKKYIYHVNNDLQKLFDEKYKPHLDNRYDNELDNIISNLISKIPAENRDRKKKFTYVSYFI